MKHVQITFLTLIFLSASIVCSAEQDVERKVMFINEEKKVGFGVLVSELDEAQKDKLGVSRGALIMDVIEDTEAEKIGLKEDDVIVKFDGKEVESAQKLKDLVNDLKADKEVDLTVVRDGKNMNFKAKMKEIAPKHVEVKVDGDDIMMEMKDAFAFIDDDGLIWNEESKGGFLGVSAKNISDQLKDYFQVKQGVLVEKVHEDTPAEKAGLKAGDVIVKIEDREINDYGDLVRTLNYYNPGEKVNVQYVRKGKSGKVSVELAEKKNKVFNFTAPKGHKMLPSQQFEWQDSLGNIKKKMKVIKKRIQEDSDKIRDINIDLDFFII